MKKGLNQHEKKICVWRNIIKVECCQKTYFGTGTELDG